MNEAFIKAIPLLDRIESAGYEAYFVGGSVRDHLLGKEIADVDIAVSATPHEIKGIFPKTHDVGIEHGTVLVIFEGTPYEVTTFRAESEYLDFRRPSKVRFIRSLKEDLQRRDFTMNAIAMDKNGRFIDPFDGIRAIHKKMIETVGKAGDRFNEDALRMMRAVRFYSQLGFDIEEATWEALITSGHLLENIAVERKLAEFEKLLEGKKRLDALRALADSGLYRFLPALAPFQEELAIPSSYECSTRLIGEEMWTFLIHCFGMDKDQASSFLKEWKLPVKKAKHILKLFSWLSWRMEADWTKEALFKAGEKAALSTERIANVLKGHAPDFRIDSIADMYDRLPLKHSSELGVTGRDLMEWTGKKPGPWIKQELNLAEKAVLEGKIDNTKESIREWLMKCNLN